MKRVYVAGSYSSNNYSMAWSENSKGTQTVCWLCLIWKRLAEIERAKELSIPVYYSLDELEYFETVKEVYERNYKA